MSPRSTLAYIDALRGLGDLAARAVRLSVEQSARATRRAPPPPLHSSDTHTQDAPPSSEQSPTLKVPPTESIAEVLSFPGSSSLPQPSSSTSPFASSSSSSSSSSSPLHRSESSPPFTFQLKPILPPKLAACWIPPPPAEPQQTPEQPDAVTRSVPPTSSSATIAQATFRDTLPDFRAEELTAAETKAPPLRASRVPSSRLARIMQFGSLAAGLGAGAANAMFKPRASSPSDEETPPGQRPKAFLSESNIKRIVGSLSRMRGAALKIGQFLSIQESHLLPPEIERVLSQVQNAADYMPEWQTEKVLAQQLGSDWRASFGSFDMVPFASASIGQVHSATTVDGQKVAVKVQFPGVADSIDSDIANLKLLLTVSALLPKGLFLDNTLRVMRRELAQECDYEREAECARRFSEHLGDDPNYAVPNVMGDLTSSRVLTMEMMKGGPLSSVFKASQGLRDHIGTLVMQLCLRELLEFRFMQTDPNWSNFLWNHQSQKLELVDFGASQSYTEDFIRIYKDLLWAAVRKDRTACADLSRELGYFSPDESQVMIDSHVDTMLALAEPFRDESFSFANQTITDRVRAQIPVMLRHRSQPPPEATYSLNRKLSGCFLLCSRLQSNVTCRGMLEQLS